MSDRLWVRELTIRRALGFPTGGIGLSELCAGVNLIRGPNASGKTTTARAIHSLLWPNGDNRISLSGRLEFGESSWLVDVDGSRIQWQREGQPSSAPALPPGETRSRYFLSLRELLQADDRNLADLIRVESAGGYDVPRAAKDLGFGAGGRRHSLVSEVQTALETKGEALAGAEQLRGERRRLDELRAEAEELRARAADAEALKQAIELAEARSATADAEALVGAFPGTLESLRDDDISDLDGWAGEEEKLRSALAIATSDAAGARAEIESQGFEDSPWAPALLQELENRRDGTRDLAGRIHRLRQERAAARAARVQAGAALGIEHDTRPDADTARTLGRDTLDRVDRHLRRADELTRRRADVEAGLARLEDSDGSFAPEELERLREAVGLLRTWLRTGSSDRQEIRLRDRLLLASAIVLLVLGAGALVLGFRSAPLEPVALGLGGLGLVTGVLILILRPRGSESVREPIEREAARLKHVPERWTEEAVRTRLDALEQAVARSRLDEVHRVERTRLRQALETVASELEESDRDRERLAGELGFDLPLGELSLHALGTRLQAWEAAGRAEAQAEATLEELEGELDRVLQKARELLEPFGYSPDDAERLSAVLKDLTRRRAEHDEASRTLATAGEKIERVERRLDEIQEKRHALWSRLGLEGPGREAEVRRLAEQIDDYRAATTRLRDAIRDRERAGNRLRAMADSGDGTAAMLLEDRGRLSDPAALRRELQETKEAAERAATVRERIAGIERGLRDARRKHDVEDAIAAADDARAKLDAQRMEDVEAEVGAVLASWLRARSSDHNRPAVFHRARELFAVITRGRYELGMSDGDDPAFRASDSRTNRGHSLDELSDGTRLQLLLAVRIAFVETLESGAALPLLLDEVLANCDDHRARAIMDAAVALAATGRQVFYFTAQADELAKWRDVLDNASVAWTERDLVPPGGRGTDGLDWAPRPFELEALPEPSGASYLEYGRDLAVPPIELWQGSIGGVHLWYLLDDPHLLHSVLSKGIATWGQLDTFAARAGGQSPEEVTRALAEARGPAAIVRRLLQLLQRGRGRPIDRAVLLESGAVSNRFIDEVSDLAAELRGNGKELIAALEANRVTGFWTQKTEELRAFLIDGGYICRQEPLSDEEILVELAAESHRCGAHLDRRELRALLARVAPGPTEQG